MLCVGSVAATLTNLGARDACRISHERGLACEEGCEGIPTRERIAKSTTSLFPLEGEALEGLDGFGLPVCVPQMVRPMSWNAKHRASRLPTCTRVDASAFK